MKENGKPTSAAPEIINDECLNRKENLKILKNYINILMNNYEKYQSEVNYFMVVYNCLKLECIFTNIIEIHNKSINKHLELIKTKSSRKIGKIYDKLSASDSIIFHNVSTIKDIDSISKYCNQSIGSNAVNM